MSDTPSDTPKTDAEVLRSVNAAIKFGLNGAELSLEHALVSAKFARNLERNIYEAEREIKDLTIRAQKAEGERDALKELSLQLAKELVSKCNDPVHRQQVAELHKVDDYFKYRPQTMCTSGPANC